MTTKRFMILAGLSVCAAYALARADEAKEDQTQQQQQQQQQQPGTQSGQQPSEQPTQSSGKQKPGEAKAIEPQAGQVTKQHTDEVLKTWPARPAEIARSTIEKYGQPHEATPSMMIWKENGPWAMTIVYSAEVQHDYPVPHTDVIQQFVAMKVPASKVDDLVNFDGSLSVHQTAGLVSAHGDNEAMNFLSINLANDIATGKKNTNQAKKELTRTLKNVTEGQVSEQLSAFGFEPESVEKTRNPGKPDKDLMKVYEQRMQRQLPTEERMKQEKQQQDETINQPPEKKEEPQQQPSPKQPTPPEQPE